MKYKNFLLLTSLLASTYACAQEAALDKEAIAIAIFKETHTAGISAFIQKCEEKGLSDLAIIAKTIKQDHTNAKHLESKYPKLAQTIKATFKNKITAALSYIKR